METEDIYTFYKEEIDSEFAVVWSQIAENLNSSDSCDVRIECIDGQYCHSHQSLLTISSQCFREAFQHYYTNRSNEMMSTEELVLTLPKSVEFEDLKSIINYIYSGVVSIPESRVLRFLETSKFLAIKGLEDIRLVFLDEIDNFNQLLVSNQLTTSFKPQPKYVLELKECRELEDKSESSDNSSDSGLNSDSFTAIKELPKNEFVVKAEQSMNKSSIGNNSMQSMNKRVGLQGRRPQIGSPLITEEFRFNDRYQCKVCLRSYLWKKSLVRHYKDLHPKNVELVTE